MIATQTLSPAEKLPKQTKLLGATVEGLGLVTTVSSTLPWCYALIEDAAGHEHHRFLTDLKRSEVTFPEAPQPYATFTRRVGIGTWDEVVLVLDCWTNFVRVMLVLQPKNDG